MLSTGMAPRGAALHRVPQEGEKLFWKHAGWIAAAMIVFVAIRVHEVIPVLKAASPVMFVAFGGLAVLLYESHSRVRGLAFNDDIVRFVLDRKSTRLNS